jgi:antagonist of KipI
MRIRIIRPGILTTVQDLGRNGYFGQAVPLSGAMDTLSARIANKAVGNPDKEATIEFTYAAAEFITETAVLLAYAGDGAILTLQGRALPPDRPLYIPPGSLLKLESQQAGCRSYLAIAGGWNVPEILGSKSTYLTASFGGYHGRKLQKGDVLESSHTFSSISGNIINRLQGDKVNYLPWSIPRSLILPADRKLIRFVPAHEFSWFDSRSITDFLSKPFTVALNSNRMGYHLEGSSITQSQPRELLSTAVSPGTIQVTSSGKMVLLMADCQTTGGYPRIAQVAAVDLALCAQLKPSDQLRFTGISREEAEILYIERENELDRLTLSVNSRF